MYKHESLHIFGTLKSLAHDAMETYLNNKPSTWRLLTTATGGEYIHFFWWVPEDAKEDHK